MNVTSASGGAEATVNANAIPNLITLLRSGNESILIGACNILINITTHVDSSRVGSLNIDVLPPLTSLLQSENETVRIGACRVLVNITMDVNSRADPLNNSSGFPRGYFHIRSVDSPNVLTVGSYSTQDGATLHLWPLQPNEAQVGLFSLRAVLADNIISQVFFIDHTGTLCCKAGANAIDVVGMLLILLLLSLVILI